MERRSTPPDDYSGRLPGCETWHALSFYPLTCSGTIGLLHAVGNNLNQLQLGKDWSCTTGLVGKQRVFFFAVSLACLVQACPVCRYWLVAWYPSPRAAGCPI